MAVIPRHPTMLWTPGVVTLPFTQKHDKVTTDIRASGFDWEEFVRSRNDIMEMTADLRWLGLVQMLSFS